MPHYSTAQYLNKASHLTYYRGCVLWLDFPLQPPALYRKRYCYRAYNYMRRLEDGSARVDYPQGKLYYYTVSFDLLPQSIKGYCKRSYYAGYGWERDVLRLDLLVLDLLVLVLSKPGCIIISFGIHRILVQIFPYLNQTPWY